jgi:glycerophosphoryl diester phosphodiesterase
LERISHRGAKRELPENSVAAFLRAVERGAQAVELDVHATRDGIVVVHHDATVAVPDRTLPGDIASLSYGELGWVELAPGIAIPSLAEVLDALPSEVTVYVEIKGLGIETNVVSAIGADTRCAVHSFDHPTIARMRELAPGIPRGVLLDHAATDVRSAMATTGARDVWPKWSLITTELVDEVHSAGGRVIAWTVNDRTRVAQLDRMGVDGVCTDDVRIFD